MLCPSYFKTGIAELVAWITEIRDLQENVTTFQFAQSPLGTDQSGNTSSSQVHRWKQTFYKNIPNEITNVTEITFPPHIPQKTCLFAVLHSQCSPWGLFSCLAQIFPKVRAFIPWPTAIQQHGYETPWLA